MKEKKEIALGLLDAIEVLGLPHHELSLLALTAISRWKLTPKECFPQEFAEYQDFCEELVALVNRMSSDDAGFLSVQKNAVTETPKTVVKKIEVKKSPVVAKGFSKNGKRLGRPKRNAPREVTTEQSSTETSGTQSEHSDESSSATDKQSDGHCEPTQQEIEDLKYGREYSLDALYLFKGTLVRTNRLMYEATPLGVFVKQIRRTAYKEFVLYYTDELSCSVAVAQSYARNKLPAYNDVRWKVKTPAYDSACNVVIDELNLMLKKMGGDKFEGRYIDPDTTYHGAHQTPYKIRYVCDVL